MGRFMVHVAQTLSMQCGSSITLHTTRCASLARPARFHCSCAPNASAVLRIAAVLPRSTARADTGAFWTAGCAQLVACIGHPQVRAARQTADQPERGCPVPPALASACFVAALPRSIHGTHLDVLRLPLGAHLVAPIAHPRAQQFVSSDASEEEQTFLENQRRTGQASQAGADGDGRLVQCSAKASVGRLEAAAELRRDLALGCSRASSGRRRPRARSDSGALRRVGRAQPAPMASPALVRTSGRAPRPPCASLTARLCSRLRIVETAASMP